MVKVISFHANVFQNFHSEFSLSAHFLASCWECFPLIKVNKLAISYHPPAYATGDCGNQVFLIFNSKSLVLTPATGNSQKCRSPQQAELFMSNPLDVPGFPPYPDREHRMNVYFFKFFFITLLIIPYFA